MIGTVAALLVWAAIILVLWLKLREQYAEERADAESLARHQAARSALRRCDLRQSADHDDPTL